MGFGWIQPTGLVRVNSLISHNPRNAAPQRPSFEQESARRALSGILDTLLPTKPLRLALRVLAVIELKLSD